VKNEVWEPNLSLIKKIGILRDQIQFFPNQLIKIRGKTAKKSKFWGPLGVKLNKFTTKDESAKNTQL
jgi:hypothetical protein